MYVFGCEMKVLPGEAGFSEEEWIRHSRIIRTWHELAHVVSGRLYPDNRESIRDEVVADCIGLTAAFGTYDLRLARLFLGITDERYRPGGRLENYLSGQDAGCGKRGVPGAAGTGTADHGSAGWNG